MGSLIRSVGNLKYSQFYVPTVTISSNHSIFMILVRNLKNYILSLEIYLLWSFSKNIFHETENTFYKSKFRTFKRKKKSKP